MVNKKVILSAYSCDPSKGSEPGNGFNWADQLSKYGHQVYCITTSKGKEAIEEARKNNPNLEVAYVDLPFGLDKMYYWTQLGMYMHYLTWQWLAYRHAKQAHKKMNFDLTHHVTWGSLQQGSFMYKLPIPFIFGPAGGGQKAPEAFKHYFNQHWTTEIKREKISVLLQKLNPACKAMIRRAKIVLATNLDTLNMAKAMGAKNVEHILDAALPSTFFEDTEMPTRNNKTELKLLWVGRFLPRKGILLVLEVMNELKKHPNITLTVVGDGEMRDAFLTKCKEYELENQINWVGKVPFAQVKSYYASHDAFFFTSLRDSSPAQLIEAMAFGLPIITLDLHGQSLMVNSDKGIKVSVQKPEKTIEELTNFIVKLDHNRDELLRLSENAYLYAKDQTWPKKIKLVSERFYQ
ncbi:glycosyltransferase family 4 protein [Cellulophaga sp. L1A9]|uniref:glycosyltransferase family 4 protein n=1 Tax=Cellulophaga sp. L1A9 TaxID=2686362 RepID=UPI00131D882B|nr:glycosyltransferase family 4 protein [Cellulophaga sp. L1A9]